MVLKRDGLAVLRGFTGFKWRSCMGICIRPRNGVLVKDILSINSLNRINSSL